MANIQNIMEEQIEGLEEKLKSMQDENPDLSYQIYNQDTEETLKKGKSQNEMLQEISDRIERMENLIKHIFGDAVLINGKFQSLHQGDSN